MENIKKKISTKLIALSFFYKISLKLVSKLISLGYSLTFPVLCFIFISTLEVWALFFILLFLLNN